MIATIGYISALMLTIGAVGFAAGTAKEGRSDLSYSGIWLTLAGLLGMLMYELGTDRAGPRLINLGVTLAAWLVVLGYRKFPRSDANQTPAEATCDAMEAVAEAIASGELTSLEAVLEELHDNLAVYRSYYLPMEAFRPATAEQKARWAQTTKEAGRKLLEAYSDKETK